MEGLGSHVCSSMQVPKLFDQPMNQMLPVVSNARNTSLLPANQDLQNIPRCGEVSVVSLAIHNAVARSVVNCTLALKLPKLLSTYHVG